MAIHATVVARWSVDGWRGVLLRGASGAGKSDLALRLIQAGWRLVADDYAEVWASRSALYAAAPERIANLIEARGVGLIACPALPLARVALIVDCVSGEPERLPPGETVTLEGVALPRAALRALDASAPGKLIAALCATAARPALGGGA